MVKRCREHLSENLLPANEAIEYLSENLPGAEDMIKEPGARFVLPNIVEDKELSTELKQRRLPKSLKRKG